MTKREEKKKIQSLWFLADVLARAVCLCWERFHRWKTSESANSNSREGFRGRCEDTEGARERGDDYLCFEQKWKSMKKTLDSCVRGQSWNLIRQRFPMRLLHQPKDFSDKKTRASWKSKHKKYRKSGLMVWCRAVLMAQVRGRRSHYL